MLRRGFLPAATQKSKRQLPHDLDWLDAAMTRLNWVHAWLLVICLQLHATSAQQVPLQFDACNAGEEADPSQLLSFTNFYGQLQPSGDGATALKVVALGSTESQSTGFSNEVSRIS